MKSEMYLYTFYEKSKYYIEKGYTGSLYFYRHKNIMKID